MATDATGSPTSLGIPTYNVDADAPSGLGFNAAMAAIDPLIGNRVLKPAGIVTGEVPVWNGTTFVRSSATPIGPSSLGSGTPSVATFLRGDGAWTGLAPYRKTTAKAVNTTVAATDLLNGEITVGAALMGATGLLRLTAWGDWVNNSGGSVAGPRFQLLLGGVTVFDTNVGPVAATSSQREPWRLTAEILNLGAANSQSAALTLDAISAGGFTAGGSNFVTGTGSYSPVTTGPSLVIARALGSNTSAANTALASALILNVINGSASASYETKLFGALVEIL